MGQPHRIGEFRDLTFHRLNPRDLVLFLLKDCCGGRADLCEPLLAELTPCCP